MPEDIGYQGTPRFKLNSAPVVPSKEQRQTANIADLPKKRSYPFFRTPT